MPIPMPSYPCVSAVRSSKGPARPRAIKTAPASRKYTRRRVRTWSLTSSARSARSNAHRAWPSSFCSVSVSPALRSVFQDRKGWQPWWALVFAFLFAACTEQASKGEPERTGSGVSVPAPAPIREARPPLRLVVLNDLGGVLEPCGCTSRPAGGIDRIAAALANLRREGVPTLVVATGQLMLDRGASAAATRTQDLFKAEALIAALARMSFDVIAPGALDLTLAPSQLRALSRESQRPLLARGPAGELQMLRQSVIHEVGGMQVAVTSAPNAEEVARLRALGAKIVIGLPHEGADADAASGADVLVRSGKAGTPQAEVAGGALLLSGGHHGEQLLVTDLWPAQTTRPVRLLERAPASTPAAHSIAVMRRLELSSTAPRDPAIRALLDQLFARINAHHGNARDEPPALKPGQAGYVGARTCAACHTQAYLWWRRSPHGRAFDTLRKRGRELDLDCIGCHVTGFEKPGGASVSALDELRGVGCESCHGAGSAHVENPREAKVNVSRAVPAHQCTSCHDRDHSDTFRYERARDALIRTGHGRAVAQ